MRRGVCVLGSGMGTCPCIHCPLSGANSALKLPPKRHLHPPKHHPGKGWGGEGVQQSRRRRGTGGVSPNHPPPTDANPLGLPTPSPHMSRGNLEGGHFGLAAESSPIPFPSHSPEPQYLFPVRAVPQGPPQDVPHGALDPVPAPYGSDGGSQGSAPHFAGKGWAPRRRSHRWEPRTGEMPGAVFRPPREPGWS